MANKYIEQAPGGELTDPDGTEELAVTNEVTDYYIQIANLIIERLRESGDDVLSLGAIADGEYLKRSGTSVVGDIPLNAPQYKITPSVTSNNLTVAIKTVDGNDAADDDPILFRVGDTEYTLAAAASVTKNAGTNWCNAGGSELAAKNVDYFVYAIGETGASAGIKFGFSRIPYAVTMNDFVNTSTDEKYIAGNWTNFNTTDVVAVIGRFRAQLSASASFNWSIPSAKVVNYPIYETDRLTWTATFGGFSANPTHTSSYKVIGDLVWMMSVTSANGTSNATTFTMTMPFKAGLSSFNLFTTPIKDSGSFSTTLGHAEVTAASATLSLFKSWFEGAWTNSGAKDAYMPSFLMSLR